MSDRIIHYAAMKAPTGETSALCYGYARPRAIDTNTESWTEDMRLVTCDECLARFERSRETERAWRRNNGLPEATAA